MVEELQAELERRASPEKKGWWENYVKGASFRGTPMREIRSAVAHSLDAHAELSTTETKRLAFELMREPLTEDKLAGILILSEHLIDELGAEDLPAFRALLAEEHLGDWSSCDWFCVKVLGRMLARSPERERIADELIELDSQRRPVGAPRGHGRLRQSRTEGRRGASSIDRAATDRR